MVKETKNDAVDASKYSGLSSYLSVLVETLFVALVVTSHNRAQRDSKSAATSAQAGRLK